MSGSLTGLGVAAGLNLVNVLFKPRRSIGFVIPDVVVSELHHDELAITMHPVEQGAPISDHAFKQPAILFMRCGWSNTRGGLFASGGFLLQNEGFINQVYQALLDLQAMREPFQVFTGKRFYDRMLLAAIDVETDAKSETALMVTCRLQEVIIVSTQAVQVGAASSSQSQPQSTSPTQSTGPVTPQPNQPSILRQGLGALGIGGGAAGGTPIYIQGAP